MYFMSVSWASWESNLRTFGTSVPLVLLRTETTAWHRKCLVHTVDYRERYSVHRIYHLLARHSTRSLVFVCHLQGLELGRVGQVSLARSPTRRLRRRRRYRFCGMTRSSLQVEVDIPQVWKDTALQEISYTVDVSLLL